MECSTNALQAVDAGIYMQALSTRRRLFGRIMAKAMSVCFNHFTSAGMLHVEARVNRSGCEHVRAYGRKLAYDLCKLALFTFLEFRLCESLLSSSRPPTLAGAWVFIVCCGASDPSVVVSDFRSDCTLHSPHPSYRY